MTVPGGRRENNTIEEKYVEYFGRPFFLRTQVLS
jgi:hypothetical protein